MSDSLDVIVIGGGASGLMAAGRAAERGLRVMILEKNKQVGKKLSISGGGRCNITNAEFDTHELLSHYGPAKDFLFSPFSQFGVEETLSFFKERGLPIVTQARKRAFPETESAEDVVGALRTYCTESRVTINTNAKVARLTTQGNRISGVELEDGRVFSAKNIVLATGGVSHPETGSTGDGFGWLKDLGHTVKDPTPTIVPLAVEDQWVKWLSGVSLSFMKITFFLDGRKQFSEKGKILFTHFGLSGPLILNLATKVAALLEAGEVTAEIDVYPDTDHGALEKRIMKVFDANKNKALKNVYSEFMPEGLPGAAHLFMPYIHGEARVHSVTKEERKEIMHTLKGIPLTIEGLMDFDRAVIADGGIPLSEVDMKTMKSKKYSNLYVTGDLLHINRPSGGYSLQLCWTTGYIAGSSV